MTAALRLTPVIRQILNRIHHLIQQSHPLDQVLQETCAELAAALDLDLVWIGIKEPDGSVSLRAQACTCAEACEQDAACPDDDPAGRALASAAISTGCPQVRHLTGDTPQTQGRTGRKNPGQQRSVLAVPLAVQNEIRGALVFGTAREGAFAGRATGALQSFANEVALSLQAAQRLEQVRVLTAAVESAANAIVITDREGYIRWVNPAFTQLTQYHMEEVLGRKTNLLRSGKQQQTFYQQMWETVLSGQVWRGELHNRRKDGTVYTEEQTITPVCNAGVVTHFIAIKQDISERKRQEAKIRHLAMHDALTGLHNRRALNEQLLQVAAHCSPETPAALLFLDLDNFKLVNDTMGHAAGDRILTDLARFFRRMFGPRECLARLGGDEFAVLLVNSAVKQVEVMITRLRSAVESYRCRQDDCGCALGISIGVALIDGSADPQTILARADYALYKAKDQGKNRTVVLGARDDETVELRESSQWAARIRHALRAERLTLYFQEVLRLDGGRVESVEALLRVRDVDGQILLPGAFLPAAERFGLMHQIDRWVVETVLRIVRSRSDRQFFVNLSGASLADDGFLDFVVSRIQDSGIPAGRLAFEISEKADVTDLERLELWMRRVKALGCRFALDDYGTGRSSIAYLRTLPVDYIKIDGSLIRNIDRSQTDRALVAAITTVCHALGKEVIAEGVEGEAAARTIQEIGIEYGQGFLWDLPGAELRKGV